MSCLTYILKGISIYFELKTEEASNTRCSEFDEEHIGDPQHKHFPLHRVQFQNLRQRKTPKQTPLKSQSFSILETVEKKEMKKKLGETPKSQSFGGTPQYFLTPIQIEQEAKLIRQICERRFLCFPGRTDEERVRTFLSYNGKLPSQTKELFE